MRIVLIHPNYREICGYVNRNVPVIQPPLGIAYIAAVLLKAGHEVKIIDAAALNYNNSEIVRISKEFGTNLIGISATTNIIEISAELAEDLKKSIVCPIIIGGPHASTMPERTLEEFSCFDMAVKGEGEYVMLEVANGKDKSAIEGLTYRTSEKIIRNPDRKPTENLDTLPFPARHLLPNEKYCTPAVKRYPYANILTSRGCPCACTFCANNLILGRRFRSRSIKNIIDEIDTLIKEQSIKEFNIIDENFTFIPERVEEFCKNLINGKYNLQWRCGGGIRVDKITKDLLLLMKKAGCYMISLGIESGDDEVLKIMKKGISAREVRNAVDWAHSAGIKTLGFFIIGNLGENRKKIEKTLEFAKNLRLTDAQFSLCIPFPGTECHDRIVKEGKLLASRWSDYTSFNELLFEHGELTQELMKDMQAKAYSSYYFRFSTILRKLTEISSFRQFMIYAKTAVSLLRMKK